MPTFFRTCECGRDVAVYVRSGVMPEVDQVTGVRERDNGVAVRLSQNMAEHFGVPWLEFSRDGGECPVCGRLLTVLVLLGPGNGDERGW